MAAAARQRHILARAAEPGGVPQALQPHLAIGLSSVHPDPIPGRQKAGGARQALQPYLAMSPSTEHPDEPLDCSLPP